jgi:diguanylate cyclase (GGDEF)-like protein
VDLVPFGVLVISPTGAGRAANPSWVDLTAQQDGGWLEWGWLDVLPEGERNARLAEILRAGEFGQTYRADWTVAGAGAAPRRLRVEAVPRATEGALTDMVVTITDVTAERDHESELAFRATHDGLTGLYNRAQFTVFVDHSLGRQRRDPGLIAAVIFLDVDGLKGTNDTYGHAAGDRLLQTVADRLRTVVRPGDVVARYGGDEFTVLCEDLPDEAGGQAIADRIKDAIRRPYDGPGECSASVGVAAADGHIRVEDLMRDADLAMYRAKGRRGRTA